MDGHGTKVVRYLGYRMVVPRDWPVYDLAAHPSVCVRFNRNAVYLGHPSSTQICPAHTVGRTEAILVDPSARTPSAASVEWPLPLATGRESQPESLSTGAFTVYTHGATVTATWGKHRSLVKRALGTTSPTRPATAPTAVRTALRTQATVAEAASAPVTRGPARNPFYTGLGFDTCSTPSAAQMKAWASSPYRAVAVYVGGANVACSQSNLTAAWVAGEQTAGWHLVPVYAGLQAPGNSCGCASIDPSRATAEGTAAATDAVNNSKALGLGSGTPIYFDMEAYTRGQHATPAVLAFVSAWTAGLHASGYLSGIYTSQTSGVRDLVSRYSTGYPEPDDIWFADWNGAQTTTTSNIPDADWGQHHRLHQYAGGVNTTYGGTTLNIDGDYLDGATADREPPHREPTRHAHRDWWGFAPALNLLEVPFVL
jgi:hypothetical protein